VLQDELGDTGFTVIAVAIDEDVDALKELAKEVSYPVLVDADHHLTELYAISNVPTVVWVDEEDQIVRPNAAEFGTDTFTELTGIHCEDHFELVRAWVGDSQVPTDASHAVADLTTDEVEARLHFRLAAHARRAGLSDVADSHFDQAAELTPLDFTVVRAAMPLRGENPFGQEFFDLYGAYREAGSPFHGIPRTSG
jgi:hypothetical protein